ncbi:MAG: thiamine pyrophosphate-dependent dehydrogenase E1 component subunit alpha [Chloroflexi bacterium]|nr:thiamine pyrophosphate-dependent dehydrogenase E1 component subunit alpha [Chloroflexota bacterium]
MKMGAVNSPEVTRTRPALTPADLLELYRLMALCRTLESACAELNPRWFPAEGEEATIVGSCYGLRPDDVVAPHYRGPFIIYLMRGADLARLFGQALGKSIGYARGRAVPFTGPVKVGVTPWVAGDLGTSLSVALGVALSFWYDRQMRRSPHSPPLDGTHPADERAVVCTFGDGTANRGDFHEALNMAALWKLPIVYVCQNNRYAISLESRKYLPVATVADRAAGYGIPGATVDGNDILAVHDAVQAAVARARRGEGPSLIDAQTYRLRGHWAEDAADYRPEAEAASWRERDPLPRFERRLVEIGAAAADNLVRLREQVAAEVDAALDRARQAPDAGPADLGLDEVLAWRG